MPTVCNGSAGLKIFATTFNGNLRPCLINYPLAKFEKTMVADRFLFNILTYFYVFYFCICFEPKSVIFCIF